MDTVLGKDYILLPYWTIGPLISQESKSSQDDGCQPSSPAGKNIDEDLRQESECKDQEKEDNVNSTNNVNVVGTNRVNDVGANTNNELPFDLEMPALEDIITFNILSDQKDADREADMNNIDTTIQVSPTLTTRILKDHPLDQVIRDLHSTTQTGNMSKNLEDHGKWVFQNKKDERGIVIRNKARLVSQGHTQEEMDIKSAFHYEKIKEEVYVCQPLGFKDPDFPNKVYKVEKALYGLHQDPRACQDNYVVRIQKKYGFLEVKNASTPMETQKPWLKDKDGQEVDVHMYRSMIGSLMYLTSSRPDIMFVVCACTRYQVNLKVSHLYDVKRIF
nr:hypothetical protein [Tanacetum cinerariifolium]